MRDAIPISPKAGVAIGCFAVALAAVVVGIMILAITVNPARDVPQVGDRTLYFRNLPKHSRPLISAIQQYEKDNGEPPKGLEDLVPKYITAIPGTGIARFPEYAYKIMRKDEQVPVLWYDLGPLPPGSPPIERRDSAFGPADHAILLLTFHGDFRTRLCMIDGLPYTAGTRAFNARDWRADRASRIMMARSLAVQYDDKVRNRGDAVRLLGEADGEGFMRDTPWELSVSCQWDKWHQDRIIYWPKGKYWSAPGWVFPVEDWLYIRDD